MTLGLCPVHVVSFDRARDIIVRASHSTVYEPNTNASASNNRILCSLQFFLTWNLKRTSNRYDNQVRNHLSFFGEVKEFLLYC